MEIKLKLFMVNESILIEYLNFEIHFIKLLSLDNV